MKKFGKILKKNLIAMIAIAVIVAGAGTVYGGLKAQEEDFGMNPASSENPNKTQVLLEGQGYSLTKEQKDKYDLPQKIEQKKPEEMRPYTPFVNRPGYPNYNRPRPPIFRPGQNINSNPTISTNLRDGTMTAGTTLSFWVEGRSCTKSAISSTYYTVKLGGTTLNKDASSSFTHAVYTTDKIKAGKNTIAITVTDPLRKKSTTKTITVTGTKKKTVKYAVTASISAPEIYYGENEEKGFDIKVSFKLKKGASSSKIINAINEQLEAQGFIAEWDGTSLVNLILPEDAYIIAEPTEEPTDEEGTTEPQEEPIVSDALNADAFDGAFRWSTSTIPSKLTKKLTITCVYE